MRAILFDLFGVLTTPVYSPIIRARLPAEEQARWMERLCETDVGTLTERAFVDALAGELKVSAEELWRTARSTPDAELFAFIEERLAGRYIIGMLTNSSRSLVERVLPADKLALFDPCLISSDLGRIKPDPEIYREAIRRCDVQAGDILFVDDSQKNVTAAREEGMQALLYTGLRPFVEAVESRL